MQYFLALSLLWRQHQVALEKQFYKQVCNDSFVEIILLCTDLA